MRVVCAPDSLKGVLSSADAAAALARGVRAGGGDPVQIPLADGGEGTAAVLAEAAGGAWQPAGAHDALGRPVAARWLRLGDGVAVVESAEAIGLTRLAPAERDPLLASSAGLGELILAALDAGCRDLIVTLGGSATVDGGAGMRHRLGPEGLRGARVRVACDVRNPLLGPRGAAHAFGPQKFSPQRPARPADLDELERRLAALPELAPYAALEGAGAAGGLGAALASLGAELVRGAELVLEAVDFAARIEGASLVITGEGQVDATSAEGKLPAAVAAASRARAVPCAVFGGRLAAGSRALLAQGATALFALSGERGRAVPDLELLGEGLAGLLAAATRDAPG